jgi:glycopeptide antibiotics resistance protein
VAGEHCEHVFMISTVLAEDPWLFRALLAVAIVGLAGLGWIVLRPSRWARLTRRTLAALSLVAIVALTLSPSSGGGEVEFCVVDAFWTENIGITGLANIVLFVPAALFGGLATRRPFAIFAAAAGLSAGVETAQAIFAGLGRSCTTSDWMLNTIGAALGTLICIAMIALRRRTERADRRLPVEA